ncbi:MAG: ATP-dependent endonuclease [Flavobacteriales bacterium]|nr:MAG: ATP-dependent endonuclease [Flavobacteriales bacterium]
MIQKQISAALYSCFEAGTPTDDQQKAMDMLGDFLSNPDIPMMVLKGSAGTGKTSLISAITRVLPVLKMKYALLAPTGRAAKVMQVYSEVPAYTIHRYIYVTRNTSSGYSFELKYNRHKNTLYIVDEASMLGNDDMQRSLLQDLLEFAYSGENNKVLLVGDHAQLPPVGKEESPALNEEYLRSSFSVNFLSTTLKQVVRQAKESMILKNATELRQNIEDEIIDFPVFTTGKDFIRLNDAITSQEAFDGAFYNPLEMESVVLLRSNKRANLYNKELRARVMFKEEELSAGDILMNTRNNYFWLDDKSSAGFIANGDLLEVIRPGKEEFQYGFRFRHATVQMIDYPDQPAFDTILMLDTLSDESPSLSKEKNQAFLQALWDEEPGISKSAYWTKVKKNPYFNALQIKFAYAITVHKSQGGQWNHVFIEQPYLPDGVPTLSDLRWLYTAITRAKGTVYLMGFSDAFFER